MTNMERLGLACAGWIAGSVMIVPVGILADTMIGSANPRLLFLMPPVAAVICFVMANRLEKWLGK